MKGISVATFKKKLGLHRVSMLKCMVSTTYPGVRTADMTKMNLQLSSTIGHHLYSCFIP